MERLRGEIKATTKYNRKLQIRVQTFEKKLELQQIKEQHTTAIVDQTNEALEKTKFEQEAHASIVMQSMIIRVMFTCILLIL